ncbi:uncharacterized protein MONOS_10261 [Monocercomonoides exilis]|uniref:uncharacterized protein n=1 Tax=Monocercomonoides exilis TaxID=2049356 RepID=UPI00355A00DD|nr:hypothetical protein MONOS_10261 [Monocercomonoides exilis]|eukprot:MONOS_10261.1-p1 / transcript=MONOS_10261.1 / gene=MONOS_10261 / organism=Monocercomonoides_exilis_PA203 / gene_product=unspecified product / transcript_product=unspecified product / location=Mono_scaffold00459:20367-21224(+) / protein_length=286 / sequence_SO=supercontig / SO=protein_coding / is_pseudo=false
MQKQQVNVRGTLNSSDQRKERTRNHGGFGERDIDRRCATRDNENRRRLRISPSDETDERDEERDWSHESFLECYRVPNWERPGGVLEDSYCRYSRRRREYTEAAWLQDSRSEEEGRDWTTEGTTSGESSEQTEQVEGNWGIQSREPRYKSSMEESPIPNLTRGEKTQTRISGNNGDDEQLFIPLGGGIEGRSGEAHSGVGGEVAQPDIHCAKEERKVEKDTGFQGVRRGRTGKTLQDGYPEDSGETPGEVRLDDHPGYIECISACQGGRSIQYLSVLKLSKTMLR